MFNEGKGYLGKLRYEIYPTNNNIVDLVNGENVNTDMTSSLGENVVIFSDTAVYLGITRAGKKETVIREKRKFRQQEGLLTRQ